MGCAELSSVLRCHHVKLCVGGLFSSYTAGERRVGRSEEIIKAQRSYVKRIIPFVKLFFRRNSEAISSMGQSVWLNMSYLRVSKTRLSYLSATDGPFYLPAPPGERSMEDDEGRLR